MQAEIIKIESLKLIGIKTTLRARAGEPKNMSVIPALWAQLGSVIPKIGNRLNHKRYAIITGDLPDNEQGFCEYYALAAVSDYSNVPEELLKYEITEGKLVKFVHQGFPQTICVTAGKAFFEWLPTSGESIAKNAELFIYDEGYDRNNPDASFEYCLFLN
ncbi:MAG: hypothetical protein OM95_15805 [Bdellovibrio sp. ArHS]|uniref:GyrI-like domain-containing protein n=1 Tax=Bdellovibrio sp. ArHS TaxID=1569284 RepID=UPI0005828010|nr:GyrI-like domain-containing protein [Bdellovibrio sp. ArHS]KHD87160.1 MAG: hypothetical protein OM95_15805 [Bdellovibrio sp. ArHS]